MIRVANSCFFLLLFCTLSFGQLAPGSTAPNFSVTDLNGGNFTLYNHTSAGKGVIIDFFATWCGPCWSFHNSGTLGTVVSNLGHIASVVGLEADTRTNTNCMYGPSGCNYSTLGNWTGVPYQQANLSNSNGGGVAGQYALAYYPTVYVVSHDNRAYEIRSKSYSIFRNWLQESFFLDANPVVQHANCGGDGAITLNRTKGYGSIKYNWSNGATTENLTNITAGSYMVTVEDQNGYDKVFGPIVVQGPAAPLAVDVVNYDDVSCYDGRDGRATALASGGNFGYQYRWSDGQTTPTATNLRAGVYNVSVTDSKGCMETYTHEVRQPDFLDVAVNKINEECGKQNGELHVNARGGVFPYTYDIGNGPQSNNKFTNLKAGTYEIVVRDLNRCEQIYTTAIRSLDGPMVDAGPNKGMDCSEAELTLNGGGSSGSKITYEWTTSDGSISGATDELITEVDAPGTYVLSVIDGNTDCVSRDTVVIENQQVYPDVVKNPVDLITCETPEVWASLEANEDYVYDWSTVDGFILSKTDSFEIEVGVSGWYFVSVTHKESSCQTTDSVWVEADLLEPKYELPNATQDQKCPDVELVFEVEDLDSLREFQIVWTTVDGEIVDGDSTETVMVNKVGWYFVEITDEDNGCQVIDSVEVVEDWNVAKAAFVSSKNALDVQFTDQSEGENAGYLWDFGDTNSSSDASPLHTYQQEGTYEVCLTVTTECGDNTYCEEIEVSEMRGPFKVVDSWIKHVDCNGLSSGEIELILEGGYPPYTISWSNGDDKTHILDLPAGTYTANMQDNQGNSIQEDFQVTEPDAIEIENAVVQADKGNAEGSIELQVEGGVSPYSYLWSNGTTANPAINLNAGFYTCEVRDANDCLLTTEEYEVVLNTSTQNFDADIQVKVFPNPGSEEVCIDWNGGNIEQVVWVHTSGMTYTSESVNQVCVNTADFLDGLYLLQIWNAQGKFTAVTWAKVR